MAKPIIDISYWQDPALIDYDKLAAEVDGVILRAAYGIRKDTAFDRHYAEFTKRGIPLGVYHYITEYSGVKAQVDIMAEAVRGKTLKLGLWCDVEIEPNADSLTGRTVIDYMTQAEARLGEFGVYASNWCWKSIMGDEYQRYSSRKLWCAAYTSKVIIPPGWSSYWLWQYSSSGKLDGYGKSLDMNKFYGSDAEFQAWIGGSPVATMNIPPMYQRDSRWAGIKLGTSNVTIGGYGCLITCAAMLLRYYGVDTDPARLNSWLIANGGYVNNNLFVFGSIEKLGVSCDAVTNAVSYDAIDGEIAKGHPVIAMVDMDEMDADIDQHWVLIVGRDGEDYVVNDPWIGDRVSTKDRYKKGFFRLALYSGTPQDAPTIPDPAPTVVGQKVRTLVGLNIRKGAGVGFERWATAPKGTQLDVLEIKGDWVRVGWNQWCMKQYNGVRYLGELE